MAKKKSEKVESEEIKDKESKDVIDEFFNSTDTASEFFEEEKPSETKDRLVVENPKQATIKRNREITAIRKKQRLQRTRVNCGVLD